MSDGMPVETLGRIHSDGPDDGLRAVRSSTGVVLCGSCQRLSKCRLGLHRETLQDDGVVISEIECPRDNEGGPNVAHGGWTAGILDEMVGHALILRGEFVVTGTLKVKFVKPVPVERPLTGRAREVGREGRECSSKPTSCWRAPTSSSPPPKRPWCGVPQIISPVTRNG